MLRSLGRSTLGCFGSLALVAVLLGVGWFGFVEPAVTSLTGQVEYAASGGARGEAPLRPRADTPDDLSTPLTRADIEAFVRIRRQQRAAMGTAFPRLQEVYESVQAGESVNAWTAVAAVRALGSSVADARRALELGLVQEDMSRARYGFVRAKINRALGLPDVDYSGILADLTRAGDEGSIPDLSQRVETATPEEREQIAYFERELRVTAPLGVLGL